MRGREVVVDGAALRVPMGWLLGRGGEAEQGLRGFPVPWPRTTGDSECPQGPADLQVQ